MQLMHPEAILFHLLPFFIIIRRLSFFNTVNPKRAIVYIINLLFTIIGAIIRQILYVFNFSKEFLWMYIYDLNAVIA